jgi:hypothetical protein
MGEPRQPDRETREQLLGVLAELIAKGGAERFLLPPVAPGRAAFPEPWAPTTAGIHLLLRRMLWHAGIERTVELDDDRLATAPPTESKPATRIDVVEVTKDRARFTLYFIGEDEVAGTLAHEVGTLHAALQRSDKADPYRTAEPPTITIDPDRDLERGSIATVYLGLGVLAANAAFQQYSSAGRFNGGYVPLQYDVLRAGAVPMSALAYLVAVQATIRGDTTPPEGLAPPQRDEVAEWMRTLDGQRAALCDRLGLTPAVLDASSAGSLGSSGTSASPIGSSGTSGTSGTSGAGAGPGGIPSTRPPIVPLDDELPPFEEPAPRPVAFRWQTHRGGVGFIAGAVMGMGIAFVASRGMLPFTMLGGATAGHVVGRRVRAPRCSACATLLPTSTGGASSCPKCGALLRGDIASLSDRLEAEERLEDERDSA